MKIRNGFVSNSSSSSFVIIGNGALSQADDLKKLHCETFVIGQNGESEFGWQNQVYSGSNSKINFAYLQTRSVQNDEWLAMLEEVIKENLGCTAVVSVLTDDYCYQTMPETEFGSAVYGYIDHQSAACEGSNTEIFESKYILARFLFCPESHLQGGNDN